MKRPFWVFLMIAALILAMTLPAFTQVPIIPTPTSLEANENEGEGANQKTFIPFANNEATGTGFERTDEDEATPITEVEESEAEFVQSPTALVGLPAMADPIVQSATASMFEMSIQPLPEPYLIEQGGSTSFNKVHPQLLGVQGQTDVIVQLVQPAVVESLAAQTVTDTVTASDLRASQWNDAQAQAVMRSAVIAQQTSVVNAAVALDSNAEVLATLQIVLNAVILRIDAQTLPTLASNPMIKSIQPILDYELLDYELNEEEGLPETAQAIEDPSIGESIMQSLDYDGTGVDVAVLDSGIDYTHVALGGAGTLDAYHAAYGLATSDTLNTTTDGLFPTAKVVGGFDFVGESWNGKANSPPLRPDPDPIDCGASGILDPCSGGHGTHVADIIAGSNGVAAGARLYAVKVCSALSSACSGVAILQGFEFAADPNRDGSTTDHVDIVNISFGNKYGLAYDAPDAQAAENLSKLGVLVVAAAGNGEDKPYVAGTPANAPSVLSVAQTQMPSAKLPLLKVIAPLNLVGDLAVTYQSWSAPFQSVIEGPLQYGVEDDKRGCVSLPPTSVAGKILLLERVFADANDCPASIKATYAAEAGALAVLILPPEGAAFSFGFGGGNPTIPAFSLGRKDAQRLLDALADGVSVRLDPTTQLPLTGQMIGSSARGPSLSDNLIKPEIGAPGETISAEAGSGNAVGAFGGTSGATPMVAGAAARLVQAYPLRSPLEFKSMLMNTAERNILTAPAELGGVPAPVTRIGSGEVRATLALNSPVAAWDRQTGEPALSFGFQDVYQREYQEPHEINIHNYSTRTLQLKVETLFRNPADAVSGAITFKMPLSITVSPRSNKQIRVTLKVSGTLLSDVWPMNSGERGNDPASLTQAEFDGDLILTALNDPTITIHLPWHILPRKAGNITLQSRVGFVNLYNRGVGLSYVQAFTLIGKSPNQAMGERGAGMPKPDLRYVGYTIVPTPIDRCGQKPGASFLMFFAVNTWERQTHANVPAEFHFDLDINRDGRVDYTVYNSELSGDLNDGRNVTYVLDRSTGFAVAYFYTDHQTNSANTVLTFCASQIGFTLDDIYRTMDVAAYAVDRSFTSRVTDAIRSITLAPAPLYQGFFSSTPQQVETRTSDASIGSGQTAPLYSTLVPNVPITNTAEGILLLYRNGAPERAEAGVASIRRTLFPP